jgi:hypothetical protein
MSRHQAGWRPYTCPIYPRGSRLLQEQLVINCFLHVFTFLSRENVLVAYNGVAGVLYDPSVFSNWYQN